jgi:hypothetical protein
MSRIEGGRDAQSLVVYGLRGVGKTVLLARYAQLAERRNWVVARVEGNSGAPLREMLGEALHDALAQLARPGVGVRVLRAIKTALSFKASYDSTGAWSFGLDLSDAPGGGANTGVLETDMTRFMRDLSDAAAEKGTGVALLIDEAQDLLPEELVALCALVHSANQRQEPLVVAMAGLPSLPRVLAGAKSYAERLFAYFELGPLQPDDAGEAIRRPSADEGVAWTDEGVEHVVSAAQCYPYFLQQFGQEAWSVAEGPTISAQDAALGVAQGRQLLDSGFFRSRWERATPKEKKYLGAVATDGDSGSSSADVASRLGKGPRALSPVRAALIGKGLLYSPDFGKVAFTVPGMADFVSRQLDNR